MRILKLLHILNFGRVGLASKITAKMQIPANSCTSIKVMCGVTTKQIVLNRKK